MAINSKAILEILYDLKDGKKEVTWRKHRLITLRLAQAYRRIRNNKYQRILDCAGYLEFRRYPDNSMKLKTANFCQTRLCPTCNWRRSKKIFAQVSRIMGKLDKDYEFVFLTLTVKNTKGKVLKKTIDGIYSAYKKLCQRKQFQESVKGWCRVLEVTYNWKSQEYHPHFHAILAVDKSYFTSNSYIKQEEFCTIWQECLGVDYKPIVDVRVFTESEKGKGKEVAEVAKYTVKSSNIMANLYNIKPYSQDIQDEVKRLTDEITDEIVLTLDSALANRRLIGYGGIFKETHKQLNLSEDVDTDLIHTGLDVTSSDLPYKIERYHWNIMYKNYVRYEDDNGSEQTNNINKINLNLKEK